jgi:hypothetical protein
VEHARLIGGEERVKISGELMTSTETRHVARWSPDGQSAGMIQPAIGGRRMTSAASAVSCGISRGFLRGFQLVWDGLDQVLSGPWCPHPRNRIARIPRKS